MDEHDLTTKLYTEIAQAARARMASDLKAKYAPRVNAAEPTPEDTEGMDPDTMSTLESLLGSGS